ncbi:hypothetical protein LY11_01086 [Pedobacter cryoconitis]|uniref:Uncharacterized protein n=2 Tax=Pedobacter cryoconitis TaxID=188932 RepID=A0A327T161_9SPHI|nr:hypothetical protein LY11_01086 [Pedobacter cryoconitis]
MTPLLTFAQQPDEKTLYLNSKNEVTTTKSEFKCIKNKYLSAERIDCYDCENAQHQIVKQLSVNFKIADTIKQGINPAYFGHTDFTEYLTGDLKAGKPYNGFFKEKKEGSEWVIYNYYQQGILVQQWYNDLFNKILAEDHQEFSDVKLDAKNTFINGKIDTGIEIIPVNMKEQRAMAELIRTVKNTKTVLFRVLIFAENTGVLLRISPLKQGYLLEDFGKNSLKITFTPEGRTIETIAPEKKSGKAIAYNYYSFSDRAKVDKNRPYSYFQKSNKLYIEQPEVAQKEPEDHDQESSRMLRKLSLSLYDTTPLETSDMIAFLQKRNGIKNYMGDYGLYEGKAEGFVYKPGDTEGTYTMELYSQRKVEPAKIPAKNKTLKELAAALKTYY